MGFPDGSVGLGGSLAYLFAIEEGTLWFATVHIGEDVNVPGCEWIGFGLFKLTGGSVLLNRVTVN
jgi:hypothetical protein